MKELKETLDPLVPRLFHRARLFAGPLAPSATALLRGIFDFDSFGGEERLCKHLFPDSIS